jgi:translation initiation factor IF-2
MIETEGRTGYDRDGE